MTWKMNIQNSLLLEHKSKYILNSIDKVGHETVGLRATSNSGVAACPFIEELPCRNKVRI